MRVHRNLHNAKAGGPQWVHTVSGKVAEYLDSVLLLDVTTRIQPAGARKCAEAGVRSVCAFFDGTDIQRAESTGYVATGIWHKVSYDPRTDDSFTCWVEGQQVRWNAADAARLGDDGTTWVINPRWQA